MHASVMGGWHFVPLHILVDEDAEDAAALLREIARQGEHAGRRATSRHDDEHATSEGAAR
jgi:hypothetical protein